MGARAGCALALLALLGLSQLGLYGASGPSPAAIPTPAAPSNCTADGQLCTGAPLSLTEGGDAAGVCHCEHEAACSCTVRVCGAWQVPVSWARVDHGTPCTCDSCLLPPPPSRRACPTWPAAGFRFRGAGAGARAPTATLAACPACRAVV